MKYLLFYKITDLAEEAEFISFCRENSIMFHQDDPYLYRSTRGHTYTMPYAIIDEALATATKLKFTKAKIRPITDEI